MKTVKGSIRIAAAAVLGAVFTGLCGCSLSSVEELLEPPKLSEEHNEIYQAVLNVMGKDISLKYPKSGEYRSAFVVTDVDDEETDEAMVFYNAKGSSGDTSLRINFLDRKDGKWVSVYDIAALGSEVESVKLDNLGDGAKSIIITYSALGSSSRAVSVLKFTDGTPAEAYRGNYSYLDFTDVNGDGGKEMLVVAYDSAAELSLMSLLGWKDGAFVTHSSTLMTMGNVEISKTVFGGINEKEKGIFVDYYAGDSAYGTEVVLLRGLNMSVVTPAVPLRRRNNAYTPVANCMDIDGDGTIEIPTTYVLRGYEELTKPEQLCGFAWLGISPQGQTRRRANMFISPKYDFYINIPSRWEGLVTATSAADGEIIFWKAAPALNSLETQLLSIKTVPNSEPAPDGYTFFSRTNSVSCYTKSDAGADSLVLTESELHDCLKPLSGSHY